MHSDCQTIKKYQRNVRKEDELVREGFHFFITPCKVLPTLFNDLTQRFYMRWGENTHVKAKLTKRDEHEVRLLYTIYK